jgi:type II secretion system protein J
MGAAPSGGQRRLAIGYPVSAIGYRRLAIGPSASRAFTLMEVMLAMAISAIVLAGIGGVFFSALRLRERSAASLDRSLPLHQAFALLRRDLQGAMPPAGLYALAGDFRIEPQSAGLGQNFRLHFYSSTGIVRDSVPWGEIQEVLYELRDVAAGANGKELVRSINRNVLGTATPQADEQPLLANVQSLEFAGYDGTDWRDTWDTSLGNTNLPSAVRVRVLLANEAKSDPNQQPFEMIVPVVTQSRTNQTSTTSTTTQ